MARTSKKNIEKAAREASKGDLPTDRERLLTRRFKAWECTRELLANVRKQQNEFVAAAVSAMRAAMEDGVVVGDNARALSKLKNAEMAWQALDEAKAERVEAIKAAREDVAAAEARLRELIENVEQLSLFAPGDGEDEDEDKEAEGQY